MSQNKLESLSNDQLIYAMPNRSNEKFGNKVARVSMLLLPLLLAAGCNRDQVKVYHVGNDQTATQAQAAPAVPATSPAQTLPPGHPDISSMPAPSAPASAASPLTWTTPAGWTEQPASEMRVASFKITGANGKQADVSVIPLSGMAGGDAANVNRWRGQIGLPAAADDEITQSAESITAGGQTAQLYDLAGKNPADGSVERILGVIQHRDDTAWFFKMTGDADLVGQQKSAFVDFLKSLKFSAAMAAAAGAGEMPATLPPGHPNISGMTAPAATGPISHEGQPNWQVPAGWTEVPGGQFLVAKFTITGDGGAAAVVNVSSSSNDGGGLAANVNRWRGQLGLQPVSDVSTTPLTVTAGTAQMVILSGTSAQTGQPAQLVGVIVSQPGQTWFYKLMGDPKVVAAQKDAFTQFVQSAKYPPGQ